MKPMKVLLPVLLLFVMGISWAQDSWFGEVFPQSKSLKVLKSSVVRIDYDANVICLGDDCMMQADHSVYGDVGDFSYRWNLVDDDKVLSEESSLQFSPAQTGVYAMCLEVKDAGILVGRDTLSIYVAELPVFEVVDDTVCRGLEATVGVTGGGHWAWSQGGTAQFINIRPSVTTGYVVRVSDYPLLEVGYSNACYVEDTAWVEVRDTASFRLDGDKSMCYGVEARLEVDGGTDVYWNGQPGDNVLLVKVERDTVIYVKATDLYGCTGEVTWPIEVVEKIDGNIEVFSESGNGDSVCLGKTVRFEVVSDMADSFRWFNGDTNSFTETLPKTDFDAYCDLGVKGLSESCRTRIHRNMVVKNCNKVFFPTGFVLDGHNKTFGPIGIEDTARSYFFAVFDVRGVMVYSTTEFTQGWDGTYKGKQVPPGAYVYIFRESYDRFSWERKGVVNVVK